MSRIKVIGRGRVGAAFAARLNERGVLAEDGDADLVLLCVPDSAIATVAAGLPTGPWIAHVSGGTPLAALAPHSRRFSVHPLQTFTRSARRRADRRSLGRRHGGDVRGARRRLDARAIAGAPRV